MQESPHNPEIEPVTPTPLKPQSPPEIVPKPDINQPEKPLPDVDPDEPGTDRPEIPMPEILPQPDPDVPERPAPKTVPDPDPEPNPHVIPERPSPQTIPDPTPDPEEHPAPKTTYDDLLLLSCSF